MPQRCRLSSVLFCSVPASEAEEVDFSQKHYRVSPDSCQMFEVKRLQQQSKAPSLWSKVICTAGNSISRESEPDAVRVFATTVGASPKS
uniref:Putative secreted protein n=1 Tax=Anopheles darlingi TaxID=43151 RepID=A0A2M4D760_ANODA